MATIAVIDYGMGNLRSVAKALEHVAAPGDNVRITQQASQIISADRVVFPGQGAIRDCMHELQRFDLVDVVRQAVANKPFLGLCLGPQALLSFSEENGGIDCLNVFAGKVRWFGQDLLDPQMATRLKVPHMGWNEVCQTRAHPLWRDIPQNSRFYFVHSYYLAPEDPDLIFGKTNYAFDFTSVVAKENVFAVQFHPEKSARWGLQLLANFSRWRPA